MWVIDLLDGISNYLCGFLYYCVFIVLVENGELIDVVIFDLFCNELFIVSCGVGVVFNDCCICVVDCKDLVGVMIYIGFVFCECVCSSV